MDLVREYARSHSEAAFAALVSRHLNLVYSVALRQVRDEHLAREIAQTVFIILARKAASLSSKTIVSGWLCQTARYTSAKAITMRNRRLQREHQASMFESAGGSDSTEETWARIAPMLDQALGQLKQKDHDALVVRFFQGRNFKEVGLALGTSEAGAKMRVNRALEKLREVFSKSGVNLSLAVIAGTVASHSVQAAPAGLATSITAAAVQGAAVTTSTLTLTKTTLKYMAWTKIKTGVSVGAIALLTVGTTTIMTQGGDEKASAGAAQKTSAISYATPEATFRALIKAMEEADTVKFAEACTPAKAAQFNTRNEEKTPEELKREAHGMAKAFKKFKITERKVVSADEVHLKVKPLGDTSDTQEGDRNGVLRMKKIGNEWKFDGNEIAGN